MSSMSSVAGQFPLQRWGFVDIFTVMLQFVQLQSWVVAVVDETSEFLWTISASVLVGCSELKGFCLSADVVETSTKIDFKSFYEFLCVLQKKWMVTVFYYTKSLLANFSNKGFESPPFLFMLLGKWQTYIEIQHMKQTEFVQAELS